jgi:hypothetical protein
LLLAISFCRWPSVTVTSETVTTRRGVAVAGKSAAGVSAAGTAGNEDALYGNSRSVIEVGESVYVRCLCTELLQYTLKSGAPTALVTDY